MMKALAPRPANSLASTALATITQTGLATFFAAAMILITASFTDASADEEAMDSVDGGDSIDVIQRFGILDHRNRADGSILFIDEGPHRRGAIGAGAGRAGIAAPSAAVSRGRRNRARLLDGCDMGHQHTGRAAVEAR